MARLRNDSRRHRARRSLRRLFPLWLIVCLVGLGLALAAYQQQRRGGIEVAEAPRDTAENRTAEAGAEPARPPGDPSAAPPEVVAGDTAPVTAGETPLLATTDEPAGAPEADESPETDTDVATASDPALEEPPAQAPAAGSTEVPAETGSEPAPRAEAERLANLDQQGADEPATSSELRTGPTAARPESDELSLSREPADSSGDAPSGVADAPAPSSEREQAAAAPIDRPAPAAEAPEAKRAAPPSSEQQLAATTESPAEGAGARQEDEPRAEAPPTAPRPGSESLTADTIRRALSALLGGPPDEPTAPQALTEQKDELAGVKPPVAESTPEAQMAAIDPEEETVRGPVAPSFDLVRVQRGGQMVVAGRAAPGAQVELRAGGEVIDQVRADPRGQWVSVPLRRLPAGDQELTVAARSGDALPIESEQVVVLAVPGDEPASGRADHPAAAAVALETPGEEALAVLLPKDGRGEGRVLQAPGRIGSDGQLALLMLDYDETGQIRLSGEASPGAAVRVYVDNELSGEALVGEDGAWTCTLDRTLAPGSYTLRVDQLDPAGQPVARLETPFTRVAQPPVHGDALVDYVIVQPGNSLWRIARRLFGSGFEYVHIYEANHAQIRDPDLIYPGQVFEIPIGVAGG